MTSDIFALIPLPVGLFPLLTLADVLIFFTIFPLTVRSGPAEPGIVSVALLAAAVALRHIGLVALLRAFVERTALHSAASA